MASDRPEAIEADAVTRANEIAKLREALAKLRKAASEVKEVLAIWEAAA